MLTITAGDMLLAKLSSLLEATHVAGDPETSASTDLGVMLDASVKASRSVSHRRRKRGGAEGLQPTSIESNPRSPLA